MNATGTIKWVITQIKLPLFCAIAATGLLSGCGSADDELKAEVRPVRVIAVDKRAAGDTVALTGTVQAESDVNLSFRIDGRMIERTVSIGDNVKPGQLIARLDPQNEENGRQAARAQLAAARAQLSEAQNNFIRMRDLVAEYAVSRAAFDQAESLRKSAESQVEAVQAQLSLSENRLSYTRLISTVAGVVTGQGAEPGEVVGAGRMIIEIAREGGRDAAFDVPARVKESTPRNSRIIVALSSDPRVTATGVVREVSPRADPVTGTFRVKVRLNNPPPAMRLGSTVTGRAKASEAESIEIPPSAVVRSGGQAAVWVVDPKTGAVSARNIVIQSSDPSRVEVASGLETGELVVTAGAHALRPGQKVSLLGTSTK